MPGGFHGSGADGRVFPQNRPSSRSSPVPVRPATALPPPRMLDIAALCVVLAAAFAYLNLRLVALPTTIGVMGAAFVASLVLLALGHFGHAQALRAWEHALVQAIDFPQVLLQGMLSFLLFAGAMQVDLGALRRHRWPVAALALAGTAASTLVVGGGLWWLLPHLGVPLPLALCLLFGALISPTDPIAVLGILKSAGAPKEIELVIAGESLFNDGVGLVLFLLFAGMLAEGRTPQAAEAVHLLLREAGGGLALGVVAGLVAYRLLRAIDQHEVEVLITLATVMGGYALADRLHVSGPLAMVTAGLVIGNTARWHGMSEHTRLHVDIFWHLVDEILNAVLFVLVGLEVAVIDLSAAQLVAAAAAIVVSLAARALTAGLPVRLARRWFGLPPRAGRLLTWGGLRGAISIALALNVPAVAGRDTVLTMTYGVVVFSILVQGLTIGRLVGPRPTSP